MPDHDHPLELVQGTRLGTLGLITALATNDTDAADGLINELCGTECSSREAVLAGALLVLRRVESLAAHHDREPGEEWVEFAHRAYAGLM